MPGAHHHACSVALLVALAAWAADATAETYVILPLIGDHITIVGEDRQTGSRIDQNRRQIVPLAESGFDDFAARTADATIVKVRSDTGTMTLRANDQELYKLRDSWLDANVTGVPDLISLVKRQLPSLSDARLLLITPYSDRPELRTDRDYRGSGKVSGLGFYLDTTTKMWRSDTGETGFGFLGVFANFQLLLINLQTGAIEAHERVVLGTTYAAAQAADRTPWNALTPAQKSKAIGSLIKQGIEGNLPGMLGLVKQ